MSAAYRWLVNGRRSSGHARLVAAITALHQPMNEEVESWADDADPDEHDRRFPECEAMVRASDDLCPGHTYTMRVCQECGYTHNGDAPAYRPWPCATVRAVYDSTPAAP